MEDIQQLSKQLIPDLPILTLKGETFQSRVSSSLLTNLNLIELITDSKNNYIKLAVELSQNSDKLINLKQKLKKIRKIQNYFNNEIYTKNLGDALEKIHLSFTLGKKFKYLLIIENSKILSYSFYFFLFIWCKLYL